MQVQKYIHDKKIAKYQGFEVTGVMNTDEVSSEIWKIRRSSDKVNFHFSLFFSSHLLLLLLFLLLPFWKFPWIIVVVAWSVCVATPVMMIEAYSTQCELRKLFMNKNTCTKLHNCYFRVGWGTMKNFVHLFALTM